MATQTTDLELKIRAALEGIEELTGFRTEVGKIGADSAVAAESARKLDGALDALAQMQEQIQRFRDLQTQVSGTAVALDSAREKQRQLSAEVTASLGPTQKQIAEQTRANAEVIKLEAQLGKTRDKQRELTQQVIAADQPTDRLLKRHEESTRKLEALARQLDAARQRQTEANTAVANGSAPTERLAKAHEQATAKLDDLTAKAAAERQQLDQLGRTLQQAGVNTSELDKASARIGRTFADVTAQARQFADAQAKLNFIPHEQLQREAQALRSSYDTLRSSGKLSAQELAQANLKLQEGLLDLERKTNGWKDSLVKARVEIGAAIAAFAPIAFSIKQAVDFEAALAGVRKVVDGSDEQFDALTGRIRDLSRELPISAAGLAQIAAAGGQLGIPIEKLDQFIQLAAKLSTAFGISAEEAGQAVAKLRNVFDLPLEGVEHLGDAINVLGNSTAATEAQILNFLTRVGGSAKTFGLSAEATAALGAALISLGKPPEIAANAINKLLTQLQTANVQSPKVQEALAGIGLSASDLAEKIRANPQAALEEFLVTLEKLDGQARAEAIAQILGVEYNDDISLLVNSLGQYRDALANVGDQQKVNGALQAEADKQAATTRAQYQLLKNSLADIVLELGNSFLPAVKAAVAAGKGLAEAIGEIVEAAPGLTAAAVTVASFAAALSGLKLASAAARVAFSGLLGTITSSAAAFGTAGTAATGAATAIGRVGTVLAALPRLVGIGIALAGAEAVIGALINIRNIQRELAEAEAATRKGLQAGIDSARERLTQYAADAARSGAAVKAVAAGVEQLTGAQREHYARLLSGSEQYLHAQIAIGVREHELYGETQVDLAAVGLKLREVVAAQGKLQSQFDNAKPLSADKVIDPALLPRLREVSEDLDKISDEDLAELATQSATAFGTLQAEIDKAADAFPALSGAGLEAALALDSRYSDLIKTKKELAATLESLREEQFKRLGVDAGEVLTGIDAKAKGLLATFQSLATDPSLDPRILTAAFKELLKTLDSPQELEALKASLQGVKASGFDAAAGVKEIETKLKEVAAAADPAAQAIKDAFDAFGIKTREELENAAREAEKNFELVSQSGQAAAGELDKAFAQVAEAQLAAAAAIGAAQAEVEIGFLAAKAQTDAQKQAVGELIEKYELTGDTAQRVLAELQRSTAQLTADTQKQISAIDAVNAAYDRRLQTMREIHRLTEVTSGGSISLRNIDPRADAVTGADRTALETLFQQLSAKAIEAQRSPVPGAAGLAERALQDQLKNAIDTFIAGGAAAEALRTRILGGSGSGGGSGRVGGGAVGDSPNRPAPSPTPQTPRPERTTEVVFRIGGERFSGLFDETAGERLIRQLQESGAVSR